MKRWAQKIKKFARDLTTNIYKSWDLNSIKDATGDRLEKKGSHTSQATRVLRHVQKRDSS